MVLPELSLNDRKATMSMSSKKGADDGDGSHQASVQVLVKGCVFWRWCWGGKGPASEGHRKFWSLHLRRRPGNRSLRLIKPGKNSAAAPSFGDLVW